MWNAWHILCAIIFIRAFRAENIPWLEASKKAGTSVLQPQEAEFYPQPVGLEEEPSPTWGCSPANAMVSATWDPEQRTQPHCAQSPDSDSQKLWDYKWMWFKAIKFVALSQQVKTHTGLQTPKTDHFHREKTLWLSPSYSASLPFTFLCLVLQVPCRL